MARDDLDMTQGSVLLSLIEFNKANAGKVDELSLQTKQLQLNGEFDDSKDFESVDQDSHCESYYSNSDSDEEAKKPPKLTNIDDDGFEMVSDKSRGKNKK